MTFSSPDASDLGLVRYVPRARFGLPVYMLCMGLLLGASVEFSLSSGIFAVAAFPLPLLAMRWGRLSTYAAIATVVSAALYFTVETAPGDSTAVIRIVLQALALSLMCELTRFFHRNLAATTRGLAASEARYRELVEQTNVIPWEVDAQTHCFVYVGPQAEARLGYAQEAWYAPGFFSDHVHPEDRRRSTASVLHAIETGNNRELEFRLIDYEGRIVWVRNIVSIEGSPGSPKSLRGVMIDITANKEIELEALNARITDIWQSARDGIISSDPMTGRIFEANPSFSRLLGYDADEMRGMNAFELFPGLRAKHNELLDEAARSLPAPAWRTNVQSREHEEIVVELSFSLISGGDGQGIVTIVRDDRERAVAERRRRDLVRHVVESQRIESLGRVAGEIAHDFNNLLGSVVGNASLALELTSAEDSTRKPLLDIQSAAEKGAHLSQQMLACSGRGAMIRRTVNLSAVVRDSLHVLSSIVAEKVRLDVSCPEEPISISADSGQLTQIITNLVSNASDALLGRSGAIRIETSTREITEETEYHHPPIRIGRGSYACLQISDSGHGMEAEVLRQSFEPFFTTRNGANGLGLAAVHGVVRGHGGALVVDSRPGAGTTVQVLLPLAETEPVREGPPAAPPLERQASDLILVIDDEPGLRTIVQRCLATAGLSVLEAENGKAGIDLLKSTPQIGGVVLDLTMPGIPGIEVLRFVRKEYPDIPVLLMSGYSQSEVPTDLADTTAVDFLAKPFRAAELREKLFGLLGRERDEESL